METTSPSQPRWLIDVLAPPGPNWVVEVHDAPLNMQYLFNKDVWDRKNSKTIKKSQKPVERVGLLNLLLAQAINQKPVELFDYAMGDCLMNHSMIGTIARHLSGRSLEIIIRKLFKAKHFNENYVGCFYEFFFPVYLQCRYSWYALDLMVRARTAWPRQFRYLLQCLFSNPHIPKQALQDYVINSNDVHRNEVMQALLEIELTTEAFVYHLQAINFVFLNSEMNTDMVRYIFKNLESSACYCYNNKDYGRLLLSLLQNLGNTIVSQSSLKKLIERHGTEYKLACLVAFDEIVSEIVAQQYQLQESRRFRVPRPVDTGMRTV